MKKIVGFLVSMFILGSFIIFPNPSMSMNEPDPYGIDPWLSRFHNAQNTAFSSSIMSTPFVEGFEWERETTSGFFPGPPVIYDYMMYMPYMDGRARRAELFAYDIMDGDPYEEWVASFQGLMFTSPALDPDNYRIFLSTTTGFGPRGEGVSTTVYCLDMETGDELWASTVDGASFSSINYDQETDRLFLTTFWTEEEPTNIFEIEFTHIDGEGMVYCLDAEDGYEVWSAPLNGGSIDDNTVAIYDGMVFVTHGSFHYDANTGRAFPALRNALLYAFNIEDGYLEWQHSAGEGTGFLGSPSVDDGFVYAVMNSGDYSQINAMVVCLDAETGFEEWTHPIQGFAIHANPIITEEYILFITQNGNLTALDRRTGRRQWERSVNETPAPFVDIRYFLVAAGDYVFTLGWNVDSSNRHTGFRKQIFDMTARGRSVYREDVQGDIPRGIALYGKYCFFIGQAAIYQVFSDIPELEVIPSRALLGDIERNETHEFTFEISNRGARGLEGTVEASVPWITVEPEEYDDRTRSITITVDTTGLELRDYSERLLFTSNGGNAEVPVMFVVVDTTPPEVEIFKDDMVKIEDEYYTNQPDYLLRGETEPTAILIIQGKDAEIDADGIFEVELELEEGENEIEIDATDDVGNNEVTTFILHLDSTPPRLTITSENYKLSADPNDYIMGQVDDLEAEVTINGEEVQLAPNGTFAKMVFLTRGINEFIVQAKDRVGNIAEVKHYIVYPERKLIVLFIGRDQAEINGVLVQLDVAPRIINNRTMVPLRFVGEAMGAEIEWEGTEQKITLTLYGKVVILRIGATTGLVNDEPVMLDAPPTIIGGRTLVPIRFISESLGASVDWEGTQQRITINFPAT